MTAFQNGIDHGYRVVVLEIFPAECLTPNLWLPVTTDISKIEKSTERELTFIFYVVSKSVTCFVKTLLLLLEI